MTDPLDLARRLRVGGSVWLMEEAADLIERQYAELEQLRVLYDAARRTIGALDAELSRLRAIERAARVLESGAWKTYIGWEHVVVSPHLFADFRAALEEKK